MYNSRVCTTDQLIVSSLMLGSFPFEPVDHSPVYSVHYLFTFYVKYL